MDAANPTPDQVLLREPRFRAADLGQPLPASVHANSVCLPTWQDVVDYEERKPRVRQKLQAGYPRFVISSLVARLFDDCTAALAREGELCHVYPSERAARRCADFIAATRKIAVRVLPWQDGRVHAVVFPKDALEAALKYWRHTGEGVSSRRAESLLAGRPETDGQAAKRAIRERIAAITGIGTEHIFLFKTGMAALFALYRALARIHPGRRTIQAGFPYVDTLKIQQDLGAGAHFFSAGGPAEVTSMAALLVREACAGIFTEFPSNPLLRSPDLGSLSTLARKHGVPLVVDDTIATYINVDLSSVADVVVTSLTKYFTGRGDVMGGAALIPPGSPRAGALRAALAEEYEDTLWGDDAVLIEAYSRDFASRVTRINQTAGQVCQWLAEHPLVQEVCYPKFSDRASFDAFRRPGGGYSGLFSVLLKEPEVHSATFFDHLEISKGPNLGTTFSLACPFTMLAHYDELAWAESCGVSRYLIRFSIGLEEPADLIRRLDHALRHRGPPLPPAPP